MLCHLHIYCKAVVQIETQGRTHALLVSCFHLVMTVDASQLQHQLPIHLRHPRTWAQTLNMVLFLLLFIPGCFMVHGFQLLFVLPLKLVPGPNSRKLYDEGIRYTKGAFATLLSASSLRIHTRYVCEEHASTSQT